MDDGVFVYSNGLIHCSVCAPKSMSRKEVAAQANLSNPTGTSSRWEISKDKTFASGEKHPAVCERDKDRRHYLMVC